jgi:plasmid stabilization system protein ParE
MYKLVISEVAHKDLDDIVSYILVELANPMAAANFLDKVEECYGYLKSNPLIYERCNDALLGKEGFRKAAIKNYILVYKVDEKTGVVNIYRFFYGAQDYIKLI